MKKNKWMFISVMILSTTITLSSNNWMSMWIGLEMNMMSFLPIMIDNINKSSSESAMIYFLVQSMSSMLLLMMVLINNINYNLTKELIYLMINISILIKLGAAPFHMWLPKVMSSMNWYKSIMLMTWQKVAPLMIISNMEYSFIINISVMMSVIIGGIGGINETSLRKMMAYSSINHLGWMLSINKFMSSWVIYIMVYSILVVMLCHFFIHYKLYYINQMNMVNMNNMEKFNLFIMMMSMGGLPPFIGFLPKWITIQMMISEQEYMMTFIMVMFSLIMLMYYIRVMMYMFLSYSVSIKWTMVTYNKTLTWLMLLMNMSMPLILIMEII